MSQRTRSRASSANNDDNDDGNDESWRSGDDDDRNLARAEDVRDILQNSASPRLWFGNPALGFLDNVQRQGAGMLAIDAAERRPGAARAARVFCRPRRACRRVSRPTLECRTPPRLAR